MTTFKMGKVLFLTAYTLVMVCFCVELLRGSGRFWLWSALLFTIIAIAIDTIKRRKLRPSNLVSAATAGNIGQMRAALEQGADVNSREPFEGMTALMRAVHSGNRDAVEFLAANGADLNAADNHGRTALMQAAYWNYVPIVQTLLAAGADVNKVADEGMTALKNADKNGNAVLVQLLKEAGAVQ